MNLWRCRDDKRFAMPSTGNGHIRYARVGTCMYPSVGRSNNNPANGKIHMLSCRGFSNGDWITRETLRSTTITSMHYPTLGRAVVPRAPEMLARKYMCNPTSQSMPFSSSESSIEVMESESHCFHFTGSFDIEASVSLSVEGGVSVPLIAEAKGTAGMSAGFHLGLEAGFENCRESSTTRSRSTTIPSVTLQPHTSMTYQITQWQGELRNLPFTAQVRVVWTNGARETRTVRGTYSGTSFLHKHEAYGDEHTGVYHCNGESEDPMDVESSPLVV